MLLTILAVKIKGYSHFGEVVLDTVHGEDLSILPSTSHLAMDSASTAQEGRSLELQL